MYARLRGVPEEALIAIVERTLNELTLLPHADYFSSSLSGGNKRKLATAIAVVGYPPVVFLDEPTSGLDVAARRSLWEVVSKVRRLGTAIILTSHRYLTPLKRHVRPSRQAPRSSAMEWRSPRFNSFSTSSLGTWH